MEGWINHNFMRAAVLRGLGGDFLGLSRTDIEAY